MIPALKSQTNSFISAHQIANHPPTSAATNQKHEFKEESRATFDFFPDIQIEKSRSPNPKNIFNKSVYVKYLSKKIEKENKTKITQVENPIRKDKIFKQSKQYSNFSPTATPKKPETEEKIELDLLKKEKYNNDEPRPQSDPENIGSSFSPNMNSIFKSRRAKSRNLKKEGFKLKEKSKSVDATSFYNEQRAQSDPNYRMNVKSKKSQLNPNTKKIIDLNLIGDQSILSSHYLNQPAARKLSDMKLNDQWPSSNMYKFSIQSNPWVKSFKEKSFANEINANFRDLPSLNLNNKKSLNLLMPSRLENKGSPNFFPSIKSL